MAILKLIKPISEIDRIKDISAFLGNIVYQTAKNIEELDLWLSNQRTPEIELTDFQTLTIEEQEAFKGQLKHQYYKVLEQVDRHLQPNGLTGPEHITVGWFYSSTTYLARIFIESIRTIRIVENHPVIDFHFWKEVDELAIRGRSYSSTEVKMEFSDFRIKYSANPNADQSS